MARDRVRTAVYPDCEQAEALDGLSERTLVPKSQIIRRGVDMALAEIEERLEAEEPGRQVLEQREARDGSTRADGGGDAL